MKKILVIIGLVIVVVTFYCSITAYDQSRLAPCATVEMRLALAFAMFISALIIIFFILVLFEWDILIKA